VYERARTLLTGTTFVSEMFPLPGFETGPLRILIRETNQGPCLNQLSQLLRNTAVARGFGFLSSPALMATPPGPLLMPYGSRKRP